MFKNKSKIILSSIIALGVLSGCNAKDPKVVESGGEKDVVKEVKELEKIKIAIHVPTSGSNQAIGKTIDLGSKMAIEENKEKFKELGFELEAVSYDDEATPSVGVENAKELTNDKEVLAMIGHFNSGVVSETLPIYNEASLVVVSPGASADDIAEEGNVFHRINAKNSLQAEAAAKFALGDLEVKTTYVLTDDTYYSQDLTKIYEKTAKEIGLVVVGKAEIKQDSNDFKEVVSEIVKTNPEIVFFPGVYGQVGAFTKSVKDAGYKGIVFSADSADAPGLLDETGSEYIKDIYMTALAGDLTVTNTGVEFSKKYKELHNGEIPGNLASFGYDATLVTLKGIEKAIEENGGKLPTREQVLKSVGETKDFNGMFTKVTFDAKGNNIYSDVFIFNFEEGKYPGITVGIVSNQE